MRVCNEAGPTGYGLCRELRERGYDCEVVEPSKTPQRRGARVKTDRRDARLLAEFLQSGHLAIVRVPTPEEEALRDLIRAFKAFKGIKALITATIVPEVGDLRRFPTAKPFASFLGLTPLRASER